METRRFPTAGFILALIAGAAMVVMGVPALLTLTVIAVWIGSLWIDIEAPKPTVQEDAHPAFDAARMGDLFEHSETPLVITRRNRVTVANLAARQLFGDHVMEQDIRISLRHPEAVALLDGEESGAAVIRGLARRRDIWRINRKTIDAELAVLEFVNKTAEADISRAHTDFVANASHELRTPLAAIIGYVETLREDGGLDEPEMVDRFLKTIQDESRRLQNLVSDLMSLSRIEAEKHDAPTKRIDLAPLVDRAAQEAAGAGRKDRVDFEAHGDFTVSGDVQQLEQLVRNLVDNGLKYGSEDGVVTVRLQPQGQQRVKLTVRDRGMGIPSEHLPHLTRRFYRTDPGRSRASGGTGLGLAIVKHIVERHRGRLSIDSEMGEGTSVTILLPLAE